jgi:hypothetical protein
MVYSGQVSIFSESNVHKIGKSDKISKLFENINLRPPGFPLDVQNLSQTISVVPGEVYLFISFC